MTDEVTRNLLLATAINPDDLDLYLVLSDHLEDIGDSRCELLRIHVGISRTPPGTPGRQALFEQLYSLMKREGQTWKGDVPPGVRVAYRFGRLRVWAAARTLLSPQGLAWLEEQNWWITELSLSIHERPQQLYRLLDDGGLPCLTRLSLGPDWATSPDAARIREQLPHCEIARW